MNMEKAWRENSRESDYGMERRLMKLDPALHRRFTDAVFAMQHYLSRFRRLFPEYSDHSVLHSLTVIDFCNRLAGAQIDRMNPDELYVLLMGCYLHDAGMGISMEQYRDFSEKLDFGDYFDTHERDNIPVIIRDFHHEYSGLFIRHYADFLDFPSQEHMWAVIQVSRGHRKTDLMDPSEYPAAFPVPGGNTVSLPYLASLIRLADEVDVAATRNSTLLCDIEPPTTEAQMMINSMIQAVKKLDMTESEMILQVETPDPAVMEQIRLMVVKMQKTLDDCRKTVRERTPFVISQERIRIMEG